jgi:uncharacterized membrane protein YuzA (DUF378 family)
MFSLNIDLLNNWIEQLLDPIYARTLLFKIGMMFLIAGGINIFLSKLFNLDLVEDIVGDGGISKLFYFFVGIAAIMVMFDRDTYLPFLGPMVAPCSVLQDSVPSGATTSVKVIVTPKAKVLYWAAEPTNSKFEKLNNWKQAYLNFDNAGVTTADDNGIAILKVRDPQPYTVVLKGKLDAHIHYRVCGPVGWMGRIRTIKIKEQPVEGFTTKTTKVYDRKNKLDTSDYSASIF